MFSPWRHTLRLPVTLVKRNHFHHQSPQISYHHLSHVNSILDFFQHSLFKPKGAACLRKKSTIAKFYMHASKFSYGILSKLLQAYYNFKTKQKEMKCKLISILTKNMFHYQKISKIHYYQKRCMLNILIRLNKK